MSSLTEHVVCAARRCGFLGLTLALCIAGLPTSVRAADPPKPGTEPKAGTVEVTTVGVLDRNRLLRPGDSIDIALDRPVEIARSVTLFSDGTFDFPYVGTFQATGLTIDEVRDRLTEKLKTEFKRPRVSVALRGIYVPPPPPKVEKPIPQIELLGAIGKTGFLALPQPRFLRSILAEARPTEVADLRSIRIKYPDGTLKVVDFSSFSLTGEVKDDLIIRGGEEIVLVERQAAQKVDPIRFKVLGYVTGPAEVSSDGDISILEALKRVGGPRPSADLEKVEVTGPSHPAKTIVNVEALMFGDVKANYVVRTGDVIVVPEKTLKVLVFGEVQKPGDQAIKENQGLLDLMLNTGIAQNGDRTRVEILRRTPDGKATRKTYNVRDIERDPKRDVPLIRGDVVFVPHKKIKRGPLYYLGTIASPIWLMRTIAPVGI